MTNKKSPEKIPENTPENTSNLSEKLEEESKSESVLKETEVINNSNAPINDVSDEEIEKVSESITPEEVKEEVEEVKQKENVDGKKETLIPLEDYIKCAIHLGTKVITPHMRKYVYKRRADGLAVINTASIDEKIREAIKFLASYDASDINLVCRRESGWPAAEKFEEATGIRTFTKKYTPGITTNLVLEGFFESELTLICDPWLDKNALLDAARLKKPVLSLCDTNNFTTNITKLIPCNNKSRKSIGCVLYLLAKEFNKLKGKEFNYVLEDFTGKLEDVPKK